MTNDVRPALRPTDEKFREVGLQLVTRFLAVFRVGRSYQVGNQVFRQQLDSFLEVLAPAFVEAPEIVLVSLDNDLYLNGVRIPVKASNLRFQQSLIEELKRRRIAGLRMESGLDAVDLEKFFALFLQHDLYIGPGLLEACLAEGVRRILPAVHASTEAPPVDDAFDPAAYEPWQETEHAAGIGAPDYEVESSGGTPGEAATHVTGVRPVATKSYSMAVHGARSLLTTTSLQDGIEIRHAKRVVQPLIDGAFANEPVVVGLSTLSHHDEYTYAHSVNVCVVAVTIGHSLGLDRRALADLGVAALLHDVGKATVAEQVRHPLERFDEADRAAARRHPVEGARLIARSTTLNATTLRAMRVACEHHHANEGGYPELGSWTPSLLSRIVAIADAYVSFQMHRSERGAAVTPYEALGMVLGPCANRFDPALLGALVQAVGIFPPGQMVELRDGRIAVVLAPNPFDLERPSVRVVMDECGVPFSPIEAKEYRPLPPELEIARALKAEEYPQLPGLTG